MKKTNLLKSITMLSCALILSGAVLAQSTCPGYKTITQGGWSSTPSGNNPGTYLNQNFAAAFPGGLTIGCVRTLKLTSPSAIRNYLPQTSTPKALPVGNLVNPSRSAHKNVFAGQLVALALNLGFDNYNANFAPAAGNLKNLRIGSGPFMGWTVQQLFDEANRKIGGCSSASFSFSQYSNAVDMVNNSYNNGSISGFLVCDIELSVNATPPLCFGGSDGAVDLTITNGIPPYSILWNNGATSEDLSGVSAGSYTVTVTDAGGQSRSTSVTVSQPSEIIPSAEVTGVSCNGLADGSVVITATGGTGSYTGTGTFSGLSAGVYTYTISDANGCPASIEVEVTEPELLVALSDKSDVKCNGGSDGSVTISATGGTEPYSGTGTFSGLAPGIYDYIVSDANGCSASISVEIMQPESIVITASSTPVSNCAAGICDGTASVVTVTGGVGPYEYFWSNGASNVTSIGGLCQSEVVSVSVVDWNKCAASFEFLAIECAPFDDCDTLRTYTQGGWGAEPSGNNPGVYLHANFAGAFPSGLTIGCDNTLTLTSAQVITDWLPSGTTPSLLPAGNMVDDITYDNVFASQLVAATLNVVFDQYDANFSPSPDALADRLMNVAPFNGMTVAQLLAEANNAIGGCATSYGLSELTGALDAINNNYHNGTQSNGNLICDDKKEEVRYANSSSVTLESLMPNPASDAVSVVVNTSEVSVVSVEVLDVAGRILVSENVNSVIGLNNIALDLSGIVPQMCLVRIKAGNDLLTRHLIIQR